METSNRIDTELNQFFDLQFIRPSSEEINDASMATLALDSSAPTDAALPDSERSNNIHFNMKDDDVRYDED